MSAHSKSNDIHVFNDEYFISLEVKNKQTISQDDIHKFERDNEILDK